MTPRDEKRLHSLVDAISKATDELQQACHAITKYIETKREASKSGDPQRISALHLELKKTERYYSEQKKSYDLQYSSFWVGVATLVLLGIYTLYTKFSWNELHNANEATATSLKQTVEFFPTDERAWVEIDRIERENRGKGIFRYRLYAKNTGKTSAHEVSVSAARSMQTSIELESNADQMRRTQDGILLNRSPSTGPGPVENPIPKVLAPGTTAVVPFVIDGQEPQTFRQGEWVSYLSLVRHASHPEAPN